MHLLIITQLISGLVSGVLLTLIAIGVALTFGLLKVVNLSHGAIYTLGAYIGLTTVRICGNFWIGLVLGRSSQESLESFLRGSVSGKSTNTLLWVSSSPLH